MKPCCSCDCHCRDRILALESVVRDLRTALRAAEPELGDDSDPGPFRRYVRLTDAAIVASLKAVPE